MDIKEKIELIKSSSSKEILNGAANNGTPLLKYVFEIHEEVFGIACKTCSSLIPGYIKKIHSINLNSEIMSAKERKYRMKSGSVIHVRGTNKYFSDLNLTDEVAEKLLKVNPNRAALFAKIPDGALERLAKEKAEEEEKAKAEAERLAAEEAAKKAEAESKEQEDAKNLEVVTDDQPSEQPQPEEKAEEKPDEELTFTELREKYPDIKARSKEGFLKDLEEAQK